MWNDRQIAVEETNYNANNILHVLYFNIFYICLWLSLVVELNVGYSYKPNIKSISHRTSKKVRKTKSLNKKYKLRGHNSAKNHSTRTDDYLVQPKGWISNALCYCSPMLCVQWVKVGDDCSFLVSYRRKPKGTIVLGSVRPSVRPSVLRTFFLRPLIYWLDIWYVAISRWVTV
jgi:hypothetical protein